MSRLIITRGLPGSGKTTWAKALGIPAVSRDELRLMILGVPWTGRQEDEQAVTAVEDAAVDALLSEGFDVVVHNMHLADEYVKQWRTTATWHDVELEVKDFRDVPLDVCIARDAARDRSVGEELIRRLHAKYIAPLNL